MKKLILTVITLALIFTMITCVDSPNITNTGEIVDFGLTGGFTDVVYSQDGSSLTLFLEGGVQETNASRALTRDLALAGHDFFEVVFYYKPSTTADAQIARASWGIGERAGIRNVPRTVAGINYSATGAATIGDTTATTGYAILFAGRRSDNTLLAIGRLATGSQTITTTTTSVTFEIQALTAGLRLPDGDPIVAEAGDTFLTAATYAGSGTNPVVRNDVSVGNTDLAKAKYVDGADSYFFPVYRLPVDSRISATYELGPDGTAPNPIAPFLLGVRTTRVDDTPATPMASIRLPRFPVGGGIYKDIGDTETSAEETRAVITGLTVGGQFPNTIAMEITTVDYTTAQDGKLGGVCSLSFSIPVYAISNAVVPGVPNMIQWFIRPGFGPSIFDLDNGLNQRGGSILLAVGVVSTDILTISTSWF
jgi:hypothetical protein